MADSQHEGPGERLSRAVAAVSLGLCSGLVAGGNAGDSRWCGLFARGRLAYLHAPRNFLRFCFVRR